MARGRRLLRQRLANHGLTLSTSGLATLLIASAAPAAAPAALVRAVVRAALPFAAGQPAGALCSEQAAGLVDARLGVESRLAADDVARVGTARLDGGLTLS